MVTLLRKIRGRTAIGLDVGASGARAVQLRRGDEHFVMAGSVVREWPPASCGGEDEYEPRARSERIRSCVQDGAFRGRSVIMALNPPAVEFHALELPSAVFADSGVDADELVHWELQRLITEPIENVETRHWALPKAQKVGATAIGVAVRRETVLQTLKHCARAGLECVQVDTGAAALVRFGTLLQTWSTKTIWGLLDLGFEESRLVLCVDDVPVLVRRAGSGGQAWTKRIATSLQFSEKAAEVQKRDHGIALRETGGRPVDRREEAGATANAQVASILLGALRPEFRELASEVQRSYEYILSCYPDRQAGDLVLVGGGAAMRNLPEFLGAALGIPVRRASDYLEGEHCRLRLSAGHVPRLEAMALATGLAVSE